MHGGSKEPARQDHWVSHLHHCHLRRRPPSLQVVWNTGECLPTARGYMAQGHAKSRSCTQNVSHLARSSLSEAAVPTLIAGPSSGPDPLCPRFASRSSRSWFEASQGLLKTAFDNCESNVLGESIEPECMAQAQEQDALSNV